MGSTWGQKIKLSIFGESHGPVVGIVMDGLPPGFSINWEAVREQMRRRAPGGSELSTTRAERDEWELLSGEFEGKTTGAPLCAVIPSENRRSGDYRPGLMRPGHADLAAYYKYKGFTDYRGGGHFSGRLTAPLTFAGAIAKQLLAVQGIKTGSRIKSIYDISDVEITSEKVIEVSEKPFPVYDDALGVKMKNAVLNAKANGDSVGGVIECAATGVPGGWGNPFFASAESVISSMMFSIPAVKGIEFGEGFGMTRKTGYECNDPMYMEGGEVRLRTNNNGGINGGITNGASIVFRIAVKPTPTIEREQETVDISKGKTVTSSFKGRHDPCIVPRAVPVAEACLALCLLELSELP